MKPSILEFVFFIGFIAINLLFYRQILAFFSGIYRRFEKRVTNEHGIVCPIATRHWPEGYDYMVLEKKGKGFRVLFYNAKPTYANLSSEPFWFSNDNYGSYKVMAGIEVPLKAISKWEGENLSLLVWKREK